MTPADAPPTDVALIDAARTGTARANAARTDTAGTDSARTDSARTDSARTGTTVSGGPQSAGAAGSGPLLAALVSFLESDGWPLSVIDPELSCVQTRFAGSTHEWSCWGRTFEPQGQVVFDSVLPVQVASERQAGVAVLLLRVNATMLTGAFAVDPDVGTIRFRTSVFLPDGAPLIPAISKGLVYANVLSVERCLPAVAAVANGELGLVEALDVIGY
jgi:hypothetical protein